MLMILLKTYGMKIAGSVKNFFVWYWTSLRGDTFAHVAGLVLILSLALNGWQYLHPRNVTVTNTVQSVPVTITKTITVHQEYMGGGVQITPQGEIKQKSYGLCFVPALGVAVVRGKSVTPTFTVRPIFWHGFGTHFGGNIYGPMIGLDYQVKKRFTILGQVGTCPLIDIEGKLWRPYVGIASGLMF